MELEINTYWIGSRGRRQFVKEIWCYPCVLQSGSTQLYASINKIFAHYNMNMHETIYTPSEDTLFELPIM